MHRLVYSVRVECPAACGDQVGLQCEPERGQPTAGSERATIHLMGSGNTAKGNDCLRHVSANRGADEYKLG